MIILTFFLLVNNLCFYSSWHVGCFCSFMRLLLLVYRKILFYFSDVECFIFDYHVIFTCLKFLPLVSISLYCSSDFYLILRALHLFPSSEFEREKSSKFFHVCREVACIGVYIINAFLREKAIFIQSVIAHSSGNSGFILPGSEECTSTSPFVVSTRNILKILAADNLCDLLR